MTWWLKVQPCQPIFNGEGLDWEDALEMEQGRVVFINHSLYFS